MDIEARAMALVNEVRAEGGSTHEALCRALERHDAFRQEVSEALEKRGFYIDDRDLGGFIIAKPDPLVEAMSEAMCGIAGEDYTQPAADLRKALASRGLEIREVYNG